MKQETRIWIAIIALLLLTIGLAIMADAQNFKRGLAIVGYHTTTIALGALADGLYDDGHKEWSHALHAAEVGMLIGGPFVFQVRRSEAISYVLSYGFLRFSFFDSFYNMTRDLPVMYNGSTSNYDQIMSKMPDHGKVWYKSCSLVLGISIPINSF